MSLSVQLLNPVPVLIDLSLLRTSGQCSNTQEHKDYTRKLQTLISIVVPQWKYVEAEVAITHALK